MTIHTPSNSIAQSKPARIIVAADYQLVHRGYYVSRIWRPAREEAEHIGGSLQQLRAFTLIDDFYGKLAFPDGRAYLPQEVSEIFGEHGDKWVRNFQQDDGTGLLPKRYSRKYERLRVIELFCRLVREDASAWTA